MTPATKTFRAKVQRSPGGLNLGACLALSAEDLSFVDDDTKWIRIKKTMTETGLIIEVE